MDFDHDAPGRDLGHGGVQVRHRVRDQSPPGLVRITSNLAGSRFSFLTMREMWSYLQSQLTSTPAPSEIGQLAQLPKAARVEA